MRIDPDRVEDEPGEAPRGGSSGWASSDPERTAVDMNEQNRSRSPPLRLADGRCADPRARAAARSGSRTDRSHAPPSRLADPRKVVPRVHDHHARRRRHSVPMADRRCRRAPLACPGDRRPGHRRFTVEGAPAAVRAGAQRPAPLFRRRRHRRDRCPRCRAEDHPGRPDGRFRPDLFLRRPENSSSSEGRWTAAAPSSGPPTPTVRTRGGSLRSRSSAGWSGHPNRM